MGKGIEHSGRSRDPWTTHAAAVSRGRFGEGARAVAAPLKEAASRWALPGTSANISGHVLHNSAATGGSNSMVSASFPGVLPASHNNVMNANNTMSGADFSPNKFFTSTQQREMQVPSPSPNEWLGKNGPRTSGSTSGPEPQFSSGGGTPVPVSSLVGSPAQVLAGPPPMPLQLQPPGIALPGVSMFEGAINGAAAVEFEPIPEDWETLGVMACRAAGFCKVLC